MHDGVLEAAANLAQSLGFGWLRFNFRGVGASSETHTLALMSRQRLQI